MKFDENVSMLDRGQAFPQFHGGAIPFGDKQKTWNPMDFSYRFWYHMVDQKYEVGAGSYASQWTDDVIEMAMMGCEL